MIMLLSVVLNWAKIFYKLTNKRRLLPNNVNNVNVNNVNVNNVNVNNVNDNANNDNNDDNDDNDDYLFNYADDDAPFKDDDNMGDDDNIGDDDLGAFNEFTDDFLVTPLINV
jgi:phosphopantothenoylcysteine synthetase/decarboxylase